MYGVTSWLNDETRSELNIAFGTGGTAVINATEEYLNTLSKSSEQRATYLAERINEDALLVCSLGLEPSGITMPVRWLVNNNSGKMYTGITPLSNTGVRLITRNTQNLHNGSVFSAGVTDDRYAMYEQDRSLIYWYYPGSYASTGIGFATPRRVEYNIDNKLRVSDLQGTQLFQTNLNQRNCSDELMIGWKYISSPNGYNDYALFEVVNGNGEIIGKFTAYDDNGTVKCLDIQNCRFATIDGTFSISYTQGDYTTPWTPAT